ncbi:MAG: glutamine amidotransferase family protein [Actinomycetes bacterium]|jgi:glutamate synthase domain-containing protein 1|nr:glutamine amidotransferase family protein [Actinomycetes bacterium]
MCGLIGFSDTAGTRHSGEAVVRAMALQHDRGNGLGAGYAGHGIYPEFPDHYAFHLIYETREALEATEAFIDHYYDLERAEALPTRRTTGITDAPLLWRYFAKPESKKLRDSGISDDDYVVNAVMHINTSIEGATVASSGKNMGVFKGVGFPEEIGHFYRIEDYEAHTWIAHNRFPTNSLAWWGGAHPFSLLNYSLVHNGEISSYGINKRYIRQFGYICTMFTDTEVAAYLFDLLIRRHGLTAEQACKALAPPLWSQIDRMDDKARHDYTLLREIYASAMLNGPFAIVLGTDEGMVAFNDRVKLRPLVAAVEGTQVAVASEESSLRELLPAPDFLWAPKAGEPVIVRRGQAFQPPVVSTSKPAGSPVGGAVASMDVLTSESEVSA